jgi:hypothetical protein
VSEGFILYGTLRRIGGLEGEEGRGGDAGEREACEVRCKIYLVN